MKETLKEFAQWIFGPYYHEAAGAAYEVMKTALFFMDSSSRTYYPYLVTFTVIALVLYIKRDKGKPYGSFLTYLFPKSVFLHQDSISTYLYVLISVSLYRIFRIGGLVVGSGAIAAAVKQMLEAGLGESVNATPDSVSIIVAVTVLFIVSDFAIYVNHYFFHKVPLLWEFHKVHHFPRVLTPITSMQVHPVELICKSTIQAVLGGAVIGVYLYLFDAPLVETTILGAVASTVPLNIISNFRHSHIWLAFPRWLSFVLSSPAMHNVHHSREKRHIDKNFAVAFSIWDWMFGTLYIPAEQETFRLGIKDDPADFSNPWKLFWTPLKNSGKKLLGGIGGSREKAVE